MLKDVFFNNADKKEVLSKYNYLTNKNLKNSKFIISK